ncbi:MAG: hypothetical protein GY802_14950, partial [Gammaproteobacteria bacterium]|nr:hypothetical protein [Gammaproteobacteria bacterium]
MEFTKVERLIRIRYIVALALIALMVTAAYLNLQRAGSEQRNLAELIDLASRQPVQAQQIAYFSLLAIPASSER